jgi:hypothetical protein
VSSEYDDGGVSRRSFARAAAAAIGAFGVPALFDEVAAAQAGATPASPDNSNVTLQSEFLMDLLLDTSPAQNLGPRQIVPVTGGTFTGPKLKGTALGGGGDWIVRRPDGVSQLNVRTTLRTDDEQLIYITYNGIIYTPPGTPPGPLYWRTTPVFETAAPKYEWLTRIVSVGVGMRVPGKAAYRIFQIL